MMGNAPTGPDSIPIVDRDRLEAAVCRFERACGGGPWPDPLDFLPPEGDPDRPATLVELVHIDLEMRRRLGEPTDLPAYLAAFPELDDATRRALSAEAPGPPDLPRPFGRFLLRRILGRGAWGIVYEAEDTVIGRVVSLKLDRLGAGGDEGQARTFLREARHVAHLRHPGIVRVYEAGRIDGRCYLVREMVEGPTLADWRGGRTIDPRVAADLVADLADALAYAHALGVIHRDVSPANVLIGEDGRPRLTDFGLARSTESGGSGRSDGALLGTPAAMAPEQARGDRADARSDVYALGVLLYELLCGEPPFRGSPARILAQVLEDEPIPPRRMDDRIPRDLETIALRAMAKEPARRYPSAEALRDDLRRWTDGRPIAARPAGPIERAWRRARRHPAVTALFVLLAASLTAGGATASWLFARAEHHRHAAEAHRLRTKEGLILANRVLTSVAGDLGDSGGGSARTMATLDEMLALLGDDPDLDFFLAMTYSRAGNLFYFAGKRERGVEPWRRADRMFERLTPRYPWSGTLLEERARIAERVVFTTVPATSWEERLRGYEAALRLWEESLDLWRKRALREPRNQGIPKHLTMDQEKITRLRDLIATTRAKREREREGPGPRAQ